MKLYLTLITKFNLQYKCLGILMILFRLLQYYIICFINCKIKNKGLCMLYIKEILCK